MSYRNVLKGAQKGVFGPIFGSYIPKAFSLLLYPVGKRLEKVITDLKRGPKSPILLNFTPEEVLVAGLFWLFLASF